MSWAWACCILRRVISLAFVVAFGGCNSQHVGAATPSSSTTSSAIDESKAEAHSLTIYGYNYTDTEIGSFEVNGQGGGNLEVSIPTAGGGKSTCCITLFTPMLTQRSVRVKWTRDGDTWCEQDVVLKPPLPAKPEYLEVHFYRDGHIELAATAIGSPPRLQLERVHGNRRFQDEKKNVNNDAKFARCKLGYR
jgi:Protein of unknown function (DUF3304)